MSTHGVAGPGALTLDQFYSDLFDRYGETPAIKGDGGVISYNDLDEYSVKLANFFHSIGLNADSRVGILMENRAEYLISIIAAARAGVIAVPLNSSSKKERLEYILQDADLETLIVGPEQQEIGREFQRGDTDVGYVIGLGEAEELPLGFQSFYEIFKQADATQPTVNIRPDDVGAIYYTSGTTGRPKGTVHTHRGIVLNIYAHIYELEIRRQERMLLVTPLGHSAGFFGMTGLGKGATIVLDHGFDARSVLQQIKNEAISWSYLIPTMITELIEYTRDTATDVTSLETIVYGSAPLSPSKLAAGIDEFGDVFIQFYGLTEVPNLVTVLPKARHDPDNESWLRSVGRPTRLAEVTVFDDENDWEEDIGEVGIRAAYAMAGYLDDQQNLSDERRWIRTGDIGRLDDEGRLFILDRVQDIVIADGEPIFSTEIENVIEQHSEVSKAAVIGIPKQATHIRNPEPRQIEQSIKAIVVPTKDAELGPPDLQSYCRDQLSSRRVPESIDIVGELPETPFGKVDKQLLREPYW